MWVEPWASVSRFRHSTVFRRRFALSQTTFRLLHTLMTAFYDPATRRFAVHRREPALPAYVVCACLRLLTVNLDVFSQSRLHPETMQLPVGMEGLGDALFGTLRALMDGAKPSNASEALQPLITALLDAAVHVFFPSTAVKVVLPRGSLKTRTSAYTRKYQPTHLLNRY